MHLEEGLKGRRGVRLVATALVALCWAACLPGAATAAGGGRGLRMIEPEIIIEGGKVTIRAKTLEAVAASS